MGESKHRLKLEEILYSKETLQKIGIQGKVWGSLEIPYWKNGSLYCETDVLIYTGHIYVKPFHVIEYKATREHYGEALEQLRRSEEFVKELLDADCYKYFVHGNFETINVGPKPRFKNP